MPNRSNTMRDKCLIGPWIRRFLLEHLVAERNLARNTQRSYRDAMVMLLPFMARNTHNGRSVDRGGFVTGYGAPISRTPGIGAQLRWSYPQSASWCNSLSGKIHRFSQPRTRRLVHRGASNSL